MLEEPAPVADPDEPPPTPRQRRRLLRRALYLLLGAGLVVATMKTAFVGQIPLNGDLPPLVVVRTGELNIRALPIASASMLARVGNRDLLYLRCRDGKPLYFGPWAGVIDPQSEAIGWVHSRYVSASAGQCPVPQTAPMRLRLRRTALTTEGVVNLRFGPSTATLPVAKLRPENRLWMDGRYVDIGEERWFAVLADNGLSGWIRSDLVESGFGGLAAGIFPVSLEAAQDASVQPTANLSIDDGVAFSVGGVYRPGGSSRELQRAVARQMETGAAAILLAQAPNPTRISTAEDGAISVEVELYSMALSDPMTLFEADTEDLAQSLLIGDGVLANRVEEVYGPEAAVLLRVGFLATGVPHAEEFVDVAFVLSQDPEVQAQMSVLAASGLEAGDVLAGALTKEGYRQVERLSMAANRVASNLPAHRAAGQEQLQLLADRALANIAPTRETLVGSIRTKVNEVTRGFSGRDGSSTLRERFGGGVEKIQTRMGSAVSNALGTVREFSSRNASQAQGRIESTARGVRSDAEAWSAEAYNSTRDAARRAQDDAYRRSQGVSRRANDQFRQQSDAARRSVESAGRRARDASIRASEDATRRAQDQARQQAENTRRALNQGAQQARERIQQIRLPKIRLPGGGG